MKNVITFILTILSLSLLGQDFNSAMNLNIYFLKEANTFLNKTNATSAILYYNDKSDTLNLRDFNTKDAKFYEIFKEFRFSIDGASINSMVLISKNQILKLDTSSINLQSKKLNELDDFLMRQVNYILSIDKVTHDRGSIGVTERQSESNLNISGSIAEVCSLNHYSKDYLKTLNNHQASMVILDGYFRCKDISGHWDEFMWPTNKIYTTYYKISGSQISSITVMTKRLESITKK